MATRLYVGNLPYSITEQELHEMFSQIGEIARVDVITDKFTGRAKGFAFVEMESVAAANTATEKFNGQNLQGKTMKVNEAKPRD